MASSRTNSSRLNTTEKVRHSKRKNQEDILPSNARQEPRTETEFSLESDNGLREYIRRMIDLKLTELVDSRDEESMRRRLRAEIQREILGNSQDNAHSDRENNDEHRSQESYRYSSQCSK
jgi:hypothetical protein